MGATVDPETGELVWEFRVPLAEQPAYYNSHPPSCVAALTCTPIDGLDWQFDGHGEPVNAIFTLACKCGGKLFTVSAAFEDDDARSPIAIACDACRARTLVFDANQHGYDAVAVTGKLADEEGDHESSDLVPAELEAPHEVIVRFEYPSDSLGDPDWQGREQELFSWITILARDAQTQQLALLFEEECA